jgi:cobalamin biosynthesis Mg chelatase CobN
MANKPRPTLADHVEAAERRAAPRAQARASGRSLVWAAWLGVLLLTVLLTAGAIAFLRMRGYT